MKCPRCQQENPPQAKFCLECGVPVDAAAARPKSCADLLGENEGLRRSLGEADVRVSEASARETATSDILRVISRSQTDYREEQCAFTHAQIALVETFADQAVIAIEYVRLFTELPARTEQLTRSVDQLTALRDVGHAVISSLELETVHRASFRARSSTC
jgi:hypothetical protein